MPTYSKKLFLYFLWIWLFILHNMFMYEFKGFIEVADGLWYEENTGLPWTNRIRTGTRYKKVGHLKRIYSKNYGYYMVSYKKQKKLWHRVVFLYFYGYCPEIIDHKNRIKDDNRIENLREATAHQNTMNTSPQKNTSSEYKGVSWHKLRKKWVATICINYKNKYLGQFTDEIEAARVYDTAAREFFSEFAYLNFPNE